MKKQKRLHDVKESRRLLITQDTAFAVKEAYLKLRTSLTFCMCKDKAMPCKSFLITSSNSAEGKSVATANIAISFAMLGKKTLIIDCDMRKPMQKKLWKMEIENGIAEHLANMGKCEFGKVEGDLPLYICGCNRIPSNPTEMLSSESMKALLMELYDKFDYIFIDTPPVNTVVDAQIVAPLVDGVVIVSKAGFTMRDELQFSIRLMQEAGANLCGVILNQLDFKSGKGYGRYSRRYGYRYGYKYYRYSYRYGYNKGKGGSYHYDDSYDYYSNDSNEKKL